MLILNVHDEGRFNIYFLCFRFSNRVLFIKDVIGSNKISVEASTTMVLTLDPRVHGPGLLTLTDFSASIKLTGSVNPRLDRVWAESSDAAGSLLDYEDKVNCEL